MKKKEHEVDEKLTQYRSHFLAVKLKLISFKIYSARATD